jgi:hypothetical protein
VVHFDLGADQRHDEFLDASDVAAGRLATTVLTLCKITASAAFAQHRFSGKP